MQTEIKTINNAWNTICEFEYLMEANRNARKGKRYRRDVLAFAAALESNVFAIQSTMLSGSCEVGPYRKLWVYVPKKRLVMALPYSGRIVQWSLYQYLNPIYDKLFIEDSYACRKGKGSHKAAERLQYWMRKADREQGPEWYYLKLDISKFFYRVDHAKLLEILSRRIKDPELMECLRKIVNSEKEPFGLPRGKGPDETPPEEWLYDVGMPIGNLTSQLFANIYMNELDQFCKHVLKIRCYIRYMDDVVILAQDKEQLKQWKVQIETFLNLTLYPGREKEFWIWCASWGLFLQKPSDLGFSDDGYSLPPMDIRYHKLASANRPADFEPDGQMKLGHDAAMGLNDAAKEKRDSIEIRAAECAAIVNSSQDEHFVIWHDLEDERKALKKAIPEMVDIYGSMDLETREKRVMDFAQGRTRLFGTKKSLSGSGCNFQRFCHRAVFMGIDYEFNDFIQAVHRIYRFLQDKPVVIDILYMDTETEILLALQRKWKQYDELRIRTNKFKTEQ